MNDQLSMRLTLLKQEFAKGQVRLQELERQEVTLRETLLRISGAIEVLEEIVAAPTQRVPTEEHHEAALSPFSRVSG
ncbi:MAG TPA: hypothetical protein VFZ25_19255 [Chloroflexota bacterium]|nr:hypothetical protein [Chloroflexota bacterium]